MSRAFTLIELVLSISILIMLSAASFYYFGRANLSEALKKDRDATITILEQARSLTVSSKEASVYGVHFSNSGVVLFKGSVYNPADPENISHDFSSNVTLSAIDIDDSSDQVVFSRLAGNASSSGTLTLSRIDDPASSFSITIFSTGVIK